MKIAVMVSGGGTNLQAIIDGIGEGRITNTEICLVYSNNPNAYAIERAKKAGIPYVVKSPKEFENRAEFNEALLQILKDAEPDLIVLAGCLVVIPEIVVKEFKNRIINIHPSLIPSFCGTGYYGLKVHEKVLERGVKVSGATVHFVDEGTDTGPIILQKAVYVRDDDTPESLQRRIMEQAEWKIMPLAIDLIANNKVKVEDGKVIIDGYEEVQESILG
ncbi:formyltetrahydrofolate-dependent phosphoribosylglycinamide formyltransferase [Butyrivibrio proteoclasticus]|uniref:Phosphoribosylglycinamide formyltransferase n=1 Tax=Butyrivibrio proteoclasticus TaxID=43305 RepID=A0A1I5T9Y3_9FIRM|nr:phosphoribosylglycinamide formyltransferase [Butyrivibrio proteoclasticus]SFP79832.1 formyltetrahydrofolate-dependent phosphoribosylglycinamide formyltransferase [Butyrivibrio proteoclasticus]